jgi:hypothetical protein
MFDNGSLPWQGSEMISGWLACTHPTAAATD